MRNICTRSVRAQAEGIEREMEPIREREGSASVENAIREGA